MGNSTKNANILDNLFQFFLIEIFDGIFFEGLKMRNLYPNIFGYLYLKKCYHLDAKIWKLQFAVKRVTFLLCLK